MIRLLARIFLLLIFLSPVLSAAAQSARNTNPESLEVSDADGIPVIFKHLPNWELKKDEAVLIKSSDELRKVLGQRAVFSAVDFLADTEAAAATYSEGKLLIVEYGTPQASADTDQKVRESLAEANDGFPVFYRRIGNYNVFLFDGSDALAANALFDQIKYQKVVKWLNYDPFALQRAERAFIMQTKSLFVATVVAISSGIAFAIVFGLITGIIFYHIRRKQRSNSAAYSDGGGLTRLNLDRLTSDISSGRFLSKS